MVPRLQNLLDYKMAITAYYGLEGGALPWAPDDKTEPIMVYPRGFHEWGSDVATAHAKHFGAKVMISLMDIWVLQLDMLGHDVHWCPWFPVDCEPLPPRIAKAAARAHKRIVFSRFGERVVNEAGMDCYYVPHGVDLGMYYPLPEAERRKVRDDFSFGNDRFVIGIVAANKGNPGRKALTEQMLAFRIFKEEHPDANPLLVMHTTPGQMGEHQGENLVNFANAIGLVVGEDVMFPPLYYMMNGFPQHHMRNLYNSFDVLSSVSKGEGFGIPILEAQACGTPVIVGDWTSMPELDFSGWKVTKDEAIGWWYPLEAWQYIPNPKAIADRYAQAYQASDMAERRRAAAEGASVYDADLVVDEYWKPVLDDIFEGIDAVDRHFDEAIEVMQAKGAGDGRAPGATESSEGGDSSGAATSTGH